MIKQNVVFVENKAGSLKRVTGILADNGINIYGFACFDAPEFAIFRMICNNPDKAEMILNQRGYMNRITQAIIVDMKDQVGGLDELLKVASDSNVSLDYIYTSFHRKDLRPVVILQAEDGAVTECILKNNGFNVFTSIKMITGGEPGHQTDVILTWMYHKAFSTGKFGYAAALSFITTVVLAILAVIQFKLMQQKDQ